MDQSVDPLRALAQHQSLAQALREDLPVLVFPGDPATPGAVFPNNVFGTAPGTLVVGRMRHAVRHVRQSGQISGTSSATSWGTTKSTCPAANTSLPNSPAHW